MRRPILSRTCSHDREESKTKTAQGQGRPLFAIADAIGARCYPQKRKDQGEEGRWLCFTRDAIKARNDNLDIAWLRDTEAEAEEELTEPEDIAAAIIGHLKAALEEIETLSEELEPNGKEKPAAAREAAE